MFVCRHGGLPVVLALSRRREKPLRCEPGARLGIVRIISYGIVSPKLAAGITPNASV
jgi:hypothetical protein